MKKKKILIILIIFLFIAALGMVFWYFKGSYEAAQELKRAQEEALKRVEQKGPKEVAVKIYLRNKEKSGSDCGKVFPVERMVPNDLIVRRSALEELIKGPTQTEKDLGFYSDFPAKEEVIAYREKIKTETDQAPYDGEEVRIISLKLLAGSAYVTFSEELKAWGGDSCRLQAMEAAVRETIKQFPKVGGALLFIEGEENRLRAN